MSAGAARAAGARCGGASSSPHTASPPPHEKLETILFLPNYHSYLMKDCNDSVGEVEVVHALLSAIPVYMSTERTLVIVSPILRLPVELEKQFFVLDFPLPDQIDCRRIVEEYIRGVTKGATDDIKGKVITPSESEMPAILRALSGMTATEAENAIALSYAQHKKLVPLAIAELKTQLVMKNATLEIMRSDETMEDLKGLENLKHFLFSTVGSPLARGVLLVGIPGTGKSLTAKVLAGAMGLPGLRLNMGRLFGQFVGSSEEKTRSALAVIDALAPCILFIDELEKAISGVSSSHMTDGGTGARVFGEFLSWLQDHKTAVFTIASANDITKIPVEFLRAGRWDAIFFVDIPNLKERGELVELYSKKYGIPCTDMPCIDDWTGAEIATLFRIARMFSDKRGTIVPPKEVVDYVVPVKRSMNAEIEELRHWSAGKFVSASISDGSISTGAGPKSSGKGNETANMEVG